jgi:hypothetical protein
MHRVNMHRVPVRDPAWPRIGRTHAHRVHTVHMWCPGMVHRMHRVRTVHVHMVHRVHRVYVHRVHRVHRVHVHMVQRMHRVHMHRACMRDATWPPVV